jgi:hypothetical protein
MRQSILSVLRNSVFAIFALLPIVSFCQVHDSTENQKWIIRDFSGGLNTKLSPLNVTGNQCVIAENARFGNEVTSLEKRIQLFMRGNIKDKYIEKYRKIYFNTGRT